ncbi:P-loop containing nucleoside triphosphate hydrolase protein [Clohesyomyces aquaticus]|uniref:p-loop containing nucleoside triphosphate hydrolase protein n=1 Tax=Clohesyomyces aquaticus TaxID=1231657 RepID=A0A1Y1ZDI2_9PLEO|nr:P-loop containing nucleoside triphosphate hydrolase protein [Clohesyomyces aquaticus]
MSVGNIFVGDITQAQQSLLDLIDNLHFARIDGIQLPRIVVVGDQSAGKSSVLEAVTGIPFLRHAEACTKFATEYRLRRAKENGFSFQIIPDQSRQPHEIGQLQRFAATVNEDTDFEAVMRAAVKEIAPQGMSVRFAAKDVLVVEKCGPDLPMLTVVDLPGLVSVANRDQSKEDILAIEDLTDRYMRSSRTIVLAIVSGNQDYAHQKIIAKAKRFDPEGNRTIGVLTKPDLTSTINLEQRFIALVKNQDPEVQFALGWYVVLNPSAREPGLELALEARQQQEDRFFSESNWNVLPTEVRGANALKQRLSLQLMRHIAKYVPKLQREIQEKLSEVKRDLELLGTGNDDPDELRHILVGLCEESRDLVSAAADGTYKNPPGRAFFPKVKRRVAPNASTPSQNLRARVVYENMEFVTKMENEGRHSNLLQGLSMEDYARDVVEGFIADNVGTEFQGDNNPRLVYGIFPAFFENWSTYALEHVNNVEAICNQFLRNIVEKKWPYHMRQKLQTEFLDPHMKKLLEHARREVELLSRDQEYEVRSYDTEYTKLLDAWRDAKAEEDDEDGLSAESRNAQELLQKALIHYDLSAKVFIGNVITQVVERHLLQGLYQLFLPSRITKMKVAEIEDIALESAETRERRKTLQDKKTAIEASLDAGRAIERRGEIRHYTRVALDDSGSDSEEGNKVKDQPRTLHRRPVPGMAQQQAQGSYQQPHSMQSRGGVPPSSGTPSYNSSSNGRSLPGEWVGTNGGDAPRPTHTPPQYTAPPIPGSFGTPAPSRSPNRQPVYQKAAPPIPNHNGVSPPTTRSELEDRRKYELES